MKNSKLSQRISNISTATTIFEGLKSKKKLGLEDSKSRNRSHIPESATPKARGGLSMARSLRTMETSFKIDSPLRKLARQESISALTQTVLKT